MLKCTALDICCHCWRAGVASAVADRRQELTGELIVPGARGKAAAVKDAVGLRADREAIDPLPVKPAGRMTRGITAMLLGGDLPVLFTKEILPACKLEQLS
mmetsp:Transcript_152067/g.268474  ORF Transcript_152067/g.268474 Transcript_152067/m.268474 type:complete len:101 (-) Transcript_152067:23-325(-)